MITVRDRGVAPALLAAAHAGCTRAVVAAGNATEAVMVPGLDVITCQSLRTVIAWLRREPFPPEPAIPAASTPAPAPGATPVVNLAGLAVPPHIRLALEACAAAVTISAWPGWTDTSAGLVHMGARWYNPGTGQFTTRDTVAASPVPDPAAANPFAYAGLNRLG